MTTSRVPRSCLSIVLLTALAVTTANAQITGVTALKNVANTADVFVGPPAYTSYEVESGVGVTAATATSFTSRYTGLVTIDPGILGPGPGGVIVLASDYDVDFSVTAPGAYRLTVATRRTGDLHLIEDNIFTAGHYADMTALAGTQSGGTLTAGTLGLPDPGRANDIPLVFDPIFVAFNQTAIATIFAVSDGAPVAHSLRFTWTQEAGSPSQGDEAAVRLGGTSNDASESAGDYPGNPPRVQANDGHFVTVTLTSLCGNGVIDAGPSYTEGCDEGAANGVPGSCCATNCEPVAAGTTCRGAAGACDNVEVCDGVGGSCPIDSASGVFVECRASTGPCDPAEHCDGVGFACPSDAKSTGICRAAAGACDVAESCDGVNPGCPADMVAPNGTSCSDGDACSTGETCTAGVCGGGTGGCGPCERCEVGGCVAGARTGCRTPTGVPRSSLQLVDKSPNTGDKLVWKWTRGAATTLADFGDPLASTAYSVCVFDQGGNRLLLRSDVPAGGVCGTRACWRSLGPKGFKYKDSERTPDGIDSLRLTPGAAGKAKIKLKGRGSNLTLPALGLTTPARVQLQAGNGQCWEASYSSAIKNTTSQFKAKSD